MKPLPQIPISDLTFWNWVARNLANFDTVSAIPTVEKLKNGDAIIYESGTTRRLYVNVNGTIRFLGINNANKIIDLDGDTSIEVERTADGDIVWIKTAGSDRIKIDASGNVFIGDGGVTNYLKIEPDGTIEFNGGGTVFDDIRTPITAIRITGPGGTTPPDEVLYKGSVVLAFGGAGTDDEKGFFVVQIPHSYKEGSDITPHIHWTPEDNTAGNVRWIVTYSWANYGSAFPGETTDPQVFACDTITDKHQKDVFTAISGTGKKISSMLLCSIQREDSDGTDTYNNKDAYLLEIDFHFEMDMTGSRQALTK